MITLKQVTMKSINNKQIAIYLSIVFMSICLLSCSNKDDDNTDVANIIGTWERTKIEVTEEFGDGDELATQVQFKTNGTAIVLYPNGSSETTTYDYRNGYLYTDVDYDTDTNRITTLTNTTLVLEYYDDNIFEYRITFKRIK
jgi:hypothetical protein